MAHASLHVCIDTSDWLQATMSEEISSTGLDSGGGTTSPLMERRLRPTHDINLKCPRCDSTHTKFCYYNNYSLTQPRYFCKTCRRYWTKGGTLRSIPVGGGCRKHKKSTSKKSNNIITHAGGAGGGVGCSIGLSFDQVQFPPHFVNNLTGAQISLGGGSFMERGNNDHLGTNNNNGGHEFGVIGGLIEDHHHLGTNYNGLTSTFGGINLCSSSTSSFGLSSTHHDHFNEGNSGISFMDQRLLLPSYDGNDDNNVKPNNPRLLSLEWQDNDVANDSSSYGYNVNDSTLSSWIGAE